MQGKGNKIVLQQKCGRVKTVAKSSVADEQDRDQAAAHPSKPHWRALQEKKSKPGPEQASKIL
jgi:hypothetical protein